MAHHVLHILGTAQPQGASMARMVASLARGLDPARYTLLACFLAGNGPLAGGLERAGVRTFALDWWRGARDPVGAWKFWRRLHSLEADIVHVHFGGRSVRRLARAATGAKIVVHFHGRILEPRGLSPVTFSARGADAVVAVSRAVANQVVDGNARVIYAGVDVAPENVNAARQRGASDLVVGTAGRLIALKGIKYLLSAVATLIRDFPALRVEIAGAGPEQTDLEQKVRELGLAGRVDFLGWIEDLNSILARWDIFALPSLEEGFPLAVLEAMAAGLPVVASRVGGVPELVADGETGWLVPLRDPVALGCQLRLLLCSPENRKRMGTAAQARVQAQFSRAQMAAGFAALYDELLGKDRE